MMKAVTQYVALLPVLIGDMGKSIGSISEPRLLNQISLHTWTYHGCRS